MFAADIIGMLLGYLLKSKMPEGFLHLLAFSIFAVFGILTFRQGILLYNPQAKTVAVGSTIVVGMIFVILCGIVLLKNKKQKRN